MKSLSQFSRVFLTGRRLFISVIVCSLVASVSGISIPPLDAGAQSGPSTSFSQSCLAVPQVTQAQQAGLPAAGVGEIVKLTQRIVLGAGDVIRQATLLRPDGSNYHASVLEIRTLDPAGVQAVANSATLTINGTAISTVAGANPNPSSWVINQLPNQSGPGTLYQLFAPGTNDPNQAPTSAYVAPAIGATLEFSVSFQILDDPAVTNGSTFSLGQCAGRLDIGGVNRTTDIANATVAIAEPQMTIDKAAQSGTLVSPGALVLFDVDLSVPSIDPDTLFTNGSAFDVRVVDQVPVGLTPTDNAGTLLADGAANGQGGIWDATARTLTFAVPVVQSGTTETLSYPARVDASLASGVSLTNTATATYKSAADGGANVRSYGPISDSETINTSALAPTITKISKESTAAIDQKISYTIEVAFPMGSSYFNTTVYDLLPDGMTFESYDAISCLTSCTSAGATIAEYQDPDTGTTRLGWSFGNLTGGETYSISYTAAIAPTNLGGTAPSIGQHFNNTAAVKYNYADKLGPISPSTATPPPFDATFEATADIEYNRPVLEIAKSASASSPWDAGADPTLTYTLTVTNTGGVPASYANIADTGRGWNFVGLDYGASSAGWNGWNNGPGRAGFSSSNPIAPGETQTVVYSVSLDGAQLGATDDPITNSAQVYEYSDPGGHRYESTSASTSIDLLTPELTIDKSVIAVDGTAGTGPGTSTGSTVRYRIVLSNIGAGSAASPQILDDLPNGWTLIGGSSTNGVTESSQGQDTVFGITQPIAPGAIFEFEYEVTTGSSPAGTYTNTAQVTYHDGTQRDANGSITYEASDSANLQLVDPIIGVNKAATSTRIVQGDITTYTITVVNVSNVVAATNLSVFDTFPAHMALESWTSSSTDASTTVKQDLGTAQAPGFSINRIGPLHSVTITLVGRDDGTLQVDGTVLTNVAKVQVANLAEVNDAVGLPFVSSSPDLQVTKTPKQASAVDIPQGGNGTFTIVVSNNDTEFPARNVEISDVLPSTLMYTAGAATAVLSPASPAGVFTDVTSSPLAPEFTLSRLEPGQTLTITLPVHQDGTVPLTYPVSPWLTNSVDVSADQASTVSDTGAMRFVLDAPVLTVAKTPDTGGSILQNGTATFSVSVHNVSPYFSGDNIDLTDTMPDSLAFNGASTATVFDSSNTATGATVVLTSAPGADPVWRVSHMNPGDHVEITMGVKQDNTVPASTTLVNTIVASGDGAVPVSDTGTLTLIPGGPILTVTKTPDTGSTMVRGGLATWTLQVENLSPQFPATDVNLLDVLPADVTFTGTWSHAFSNPASGPAVINTSTAPPRWTIPVLAPGQRVTLTVETQHNGNLAVPTPTTITNTARATYVDATNAAVTVSDTGTMNFDPALANLSMTKTPAVGSNTPIIQGGNGTFTIAVTNLSPSYTATNMVINDPLPSTLVFGSISSVVYASPASGPSVVNSGTSTTPRFAVSSLAPGQSVTITFSVTQNGTIPSGYPFISKLTNTASVTADNLPTSTATGELVFVKDEVNLTVRKTPDTGGTIASGGNSSYQIVVSNPSTQVPARDVTITDTLPAGLRWTDWPSLQAGDWSVTGTGSGTLQQSGGTAGAPVFTIPVLAPGAVLTLTLDVTHDGVTDPGTSNKFTNSVSVSAVNQPLPVSDTGVLLVLRPVLSITKKPDVSDNVRIIQGNTGTYTITVANSSPVASANNVVINDTLPGTLNYSGFSATYATPGTGPAVVDTGSTSSAPKFTISTLLPGQSVAITMTVTQDGSTPAGYPGSANLVNVASATANLLTGSVTDTGTLIYQPDVANITVTKTPDGTNPADYVIQGQTAQYQIEVTNGSPYITARNLVISDVLPGTLNWSTFPTLNPADWSVLPSGASASVTAAGTASAPEFHIAQLAPGVTVRIVLRVTQDGTTPASTTLVNTATVSADNAPTVADTGTLNYIPNVPELEVIKTPAVGSGVSIPESGTSEFLIRIQNDSDLITATNLTINEVLPDSLYWTPWPTLSSSFWSISNGGTGTLTYSSGPNDAPVFSLDHLGPSETLTLRIPVTQDGTIPPDLTLTNNVTVTASNDPDPHSAQGELVLSPNIRPIVITKSASPAVASPGQTVTYTLTATFESNAIATYDHTVLDFVPDGLTFQSYVSQTCNSGACSGALAPEFGGSPLTTVTKPDGSSVIGWYFGDVAASAPVTTYALVYTATVDPTFTGSGIPPAGTLVADGVPNGDPLVNRAYPYLNYAANDVTGLLGSIPASPNAFFDLRGAGANANLDIRTPVLTIDKTSNAFSVAPGIGEVEVGASLNYTITVTNSGSASAFDVVVRDDMADPNATGVNALRNVVPGALPAGTTVTDPWSDTNGGRRVEWTIDEIPAGQTATITYTATTPPSAWLAPYNTSGAADVAGAENTATVVEHHSIGAGQPGDYLYPNTPLDKYLLRIYTPIARALSSCYGGSASWPSVYTGPGPIPASSKRLVGQAWNGDPNTGLPYPYWSITQVNGSGVGSNAVLRIVLSPSLTYTPGSAWATGRAVGQTDLNSWSTFRDPDSISADGRTLTWNLGNVTPSLVDPAIKVMVDAFDSSPPGAQSVNATVSYLDAMGNSSRGTSSGFTNNYSSSGGNNCYLDPPRIRLYKYPDSSPILPGQSASYSVNVALINGGLPAIVKAGTVLTDVLPAGLTYTGATFSPAIAYSELVTPLPGGATKIEWTLTADVTASFSIVVPITIPAGAASGTLYQNSAVIDAVVPHNTCGDYSCSGGAGNVIADDVGSYLVKNAGAPTIEKSAASSVVDFDSSTVFTLDVTIPANITFSDVLVADNLNLSSTSPYSPRPTFGGYLTAACVSGCDSPPGTGDDITITTLPVTAPTGYAGWLLQSPNPGTLGLLNVDSDERVVRLTYQMDLPSLSDSAYSAALADHATWSTVATTFTDRAMVSVSTDELLSTNNVDYLAAGLGWKAHWDGARVLARAEINDQDDETVETHLPVVEADKSCVALPPNGQDVSSFAHGDLVVEPTATGISNVQCTITLTNTSEFPAFDVVVRDTPQLTATVEAYAGGPTTSVPIDLTVQSYLSPGPEFTWADGLGHIDWRVLQIDPGQSISVGFVGRLDPWDPSVNFPNLTQPNLHYAWSSNSAEVLSWGHRDDPGTPRFGYDSDSVEMLYLEPEIHVSKADRNNFDRWVGEGADPATPFLITGTPSGPQTQVRVPGEQVNWVTQFTQSLGKAFDRLEVNDTLPSAWRYVPGSAHLVDDSGVAVPIEPVIIGSPTDVCSAAPSTPGNNNSGQVIRWEFLLGAAGVYGDLWRTNDHHRAVNTGFAGDLGSGDPLWTRSWHLEYTTEILPEASECVAPSEGSDYFTNSVTVQSSSSDGTFESEDDSDFGSGNSLPAPSIAVATTTNEVEAAHAAAGGSDREPWLTTVPDGDPSYPSYYTGLAGLPGVGVRQVGDVVNMVLQVSTTDLHAFNLATVSDIAPVGWDFVPSSAFLVTQDGTRVDLAAITTVTPSSTACANGSFPNADGDRVSFAFDKAGNLFERALWESEPWARNAAPRVAGDPTWWESYYRIELQLRVSDEAASCVVQMDNESADRFTNTAQVAAQNTTNNWALGDAWRWRAEVVRLSGIKIGKAPIEVIDSFDSAGVPLTTPYLVNGPLGDSLPTVYPGLSGVPGVAVRHVGDTVEWTVQLTTVDVDGMDQISISDRLPAGFRYVAGSMRLVDGAGVEHDLSAATSYTEDLSCPSTPSVPSPGDGYGASSLDLAFDRSVGTGNPARALWDNSPFASNASVIDPTVASGYWEDLFVLKFTTTVEPQAALCTNVSMGYGYSTNAIDVDARSHARRVSSSKNGFTAQVVLAPSLQIAKLRPEVESGLGDLGSDLNTPFLAEYESSDTQYPSVYPDTVGSHGQALDKIGDTVPYVVQVAAAELAALNNFVITDAMPAGWSYSPGSAVLVDGAGVRHPLEDPTAQGDPPVCDPSGGSASGDSISFTFDRAGAPAAQLPWTTAPYRTGAASDPTAGLPLRWTEYVRIEFALHIDDAAGDCLTADFNLFPNKIRIRSEDSLDIDWPFTFLPQVIERPRVHVSKLTQTIEQAMLADATLAAGVPFDFNRHDSEDSYSQYGSVGAFNGLGVHQVGDVVPFAAHVATVALHNANSLRVREVVPAGWTVDPSSVVLVDGSGTRHSLSSMVSPSYHLSCNDTGFPEANADGGEFDLVFDRSAPPGSAASLPWTTAPYATNSVANVPVIHESWGDYLRIEFSLTVGPSAADCIGTTFAYFTNVISAAVLSGSGVYGKGNKYQWKPEVVVRPQLLTAKYTKAFEDRYLADNPSYVGAPLAITPNRTNLSGNRDYRVGEVIPFRLDVAATGINGMQTLLLNDQLPSGFHYRPGSARLVGQGASFAIEPILTPGSQCDGDSMQWGFRRGDPGAVGAPWQPAGQYLINPDPASALGTDSSWGVGLRVEFEVDTAGAFGCVFGTNMNSEGLAKWTNDLEVRGQMDSGNWLGDPIKVVHFSDDLLGADMSIEKYTREAYDIYVAAIPDRANDPVGDALRWLSEADVYNDHNSSPVPPPARSLGDSVVWDLEVTGVGVQSFSGFQVKDTLPYGWTYQPGTAVLVSHAPDGSEVRTPLEPTVTAGTGWCSSLYPSWGNNPDGDSLNWEFSMDSLDPGAAGPWNGLSFVHNPDRWGRPSGYATRFWNDSYRIEFTTTIGKAAADCIDHEQTGYQYNYFTNNAEFHITGAGTWVPGTAGGWNGLNEGFYGTWYAGYDMRTCNSYWDWYCDALYGPWESLYYGSGYPGSSYVGHFDLRSCEWEWGEKCIVSYWRQYPFFGSVNGMVNYPTSPIFNGFDMTICVVSWQSYCDGNFDRWNVSGDLTTAPGGSWFRPTDGSGLNMAECHAYLNGYLGSPPPHDCSGHDAWWESLSAGYVESVGFADGHFDSDREPYYPHDNRVSWYHETVIEPAVYLGKTTQDFDDYLRTIPSNEADLLNLADWPYTAGTSQIWGYDTSVLDHGVSTSHLSGQKGQKMTERHLGENVGWVLQAATSGFNGLSEFSLTDRLPTGYEYVPGSAALVTRDALGVEHRYPYEPDIEVGGQHCVSNSNDDGDRLSWRFDKGGAGVAGIPWYEQYSLRPSAINDANFVMPWIGKELWEQYHRIELTTRVSSVALGCVDESDGWGGAAIDRFPNNLEARAADLGGEDVKVGATTWYPEGVVRTWPVIAKTDSKTTELFQSVECIDPTQLECKVISMNTDKIPMPYQSGEQIHYSLFVSLDDPDDFNRLDVSDALPIGQTYVPGSGAYIVTDSSGVEHSYPITDPVITPGIPPEQCETGVENGNIGGDNFEWTFIDGGAGVVGKPWITEAWLDLRNVPMGVGPRVDQLLQRHVKYVVRLDYSALMTPQFVDCVGEGQRFALAQNTGNLSATAQDGSTWQTHADAGVVVWDALTAEKLPDGGTVSDGVTTNFSIVVRNYFPTMTGLPGDDSEAFFDRLFEAETIENPEITDTFEVCGNSTYVPGSATARLADGTPVNLVEVSSTEVILANGCRQITTVWHIDTIGPSSLQWILGKGEPDFSAFNEIAIQVPIVIPNGEADGTVLNNTMTLTAPELHNPITDAAQLTVVNPSQPPSGVTISGPPVRTVNERGRYTASVTIPARATYFDLGFTLDVPEGMTLAGYGPIGCTTPSGATCPSWPVGTYAPLTNPDGTTSIGWWFGDLVGNGEDRTFTLTYDTVVDAQHENLLPVLAGDVMTHSVHGYSNDDNMEPEVVSAIPDPTMFDYQGSDAATDTLIVEPHVIVQKQILAPNPIVPVGPGALITYEVTMTNTGDQNAYYLMLEDTPPSYLTNVVAVPAPGFEVDGWAPAGPRMAWYIPQLAPGESKSFTYTAEVTPDVITDGVGTIDNLARTSTYQGLPGRNAANRIYDGATVVGQVPVVGPRVNVEKYAGAACVDENQIVALGTEAEFCVVVSNIGDGIARSVELRDRIPLGYTFVPGSAHDGAGTPIADPPSASPLTFPIGDLTAGQAVEVHYRIAAPTSVREGFQPSLNLAYAEALNDSGLRMPLTATAFHSMDSATVALSAYALEVSKTPEGRVEQYVPGGGPISWDITVKNSGTAPLNNVEVIDTMPLGIVFDSASVTPDSVTPPVHDPAVATVLSWHIPSMNPGETVTITVNATVPAGLTAETRFINDVQATADEVALPVADQAMLIAFRGAAIGDFVWDDTNGDGVQDPGEPGIDGVRVQLLDSMGAVVTETTTGLNGAWVISDIAPGTYQIRVIAPVGMVGSPTGSGSSSTDSDPDPTTLTTASITLAANEVRTDVDAGLYAPASIGDQVWLDADADGVQDPTETGVAGVHVVLYDGSGVMVAATDTAPDGTYAFNGLAPGDYRVELVLPGGQHLSPQGRGSDPLLDSDFNLDGGGTTASATVTLVSGGHAELDGGLYALANVTGDLWMDLDGDGQREAGDDLFAGTVTVELLDGTGAVVGTATVTNGHYDFTDVVPGTYSVHVIPPAATGLTIFGPDSQFVVATATSPSAGLASGATMVVNGGLIALGSLTVNLFEDAMADGQSVSDTPITGTVELLDGSGNVIQTAAVGPTGVVTFTDLPPGNYSYRAIVADTWVVTDANLGADASDSDVTDGGIVGTDRIAISGVITVAGGSESSSAGFYRPASLGDQIWLDPNTNGIQDAGEHGLTGVTVQLLDGSGSVIRELNTAQGGAFANLSLADPDGTYHFNQLRPGNYRVRVIAPTGYRLSPADATVDTDDSDANVTTGETQLVTLRSGDQISDLDAGLHQASDLVVVLWIDYDADGVRDLDEPPISGIDLNVIDPITGAVITTIRTGADGSATAPGLPIGNYVIVPVTPDGYTISPLAVDNELDPSTGRTGTIDSGARAGSAILGGLVPPMDLTVEKSSDEASVLPGGHVIWTIEVSNLNGRTVHNATVVDELPTGLSFVSAASSDATCAADGQMVKCTLTRDLAHGESVTVALETLVTAQDARTITNVASVEVDGKTDTADGQAKVGVDGKEPSGPLAYTGMSMVALVMLGGILLGSGTAVAMTRRRRRDV